jgi:hypothetical protein
MFKTTPRSVLLGGDLLRKSAGRLIVNEDGTLSRYDDTLTEEDLVDPQTGKGGVPDPHGGDWMVDRAPTGSGPNHRHMIDALLHVMLQLSAKKGYGPNDEIGIRRNGTVEATTLKDLYIEIIDHGIGSRNDKVIEIEGEDSPNILSGFRSKRWRTNHGSGHFSEKDANKIYEDGKMLPVAKDPIHGVTKIEDREGNIREVPHQVTHFGKKGNVDDPDADQGNHIDSVYNPIPSEMKEVLGQAAPWLKENIVGIPEGQVGPLDGWDNDRALRRFTRGHVLPLSAVSEGQVHALNDTDMSAVRMDKLPSRFLRHYQDYSGGRFARAPEQQKEYPNLSHAGYPVPKYALESHKKTGTTKRREDSFNRLGAMQQFLQSIVGDKEKNIPGKFPHMSPESIADAEDLLAREETEGALGANVLSPKMSALFGIGTKVGDADNRTDVSSIIDDGIYNKRFQKLYTKLGLTEQDIETAVRRSTVTNSSKNTTSKDADKAAEAFHALHLALTDKERSKGTETPHLVAADIIQNHGELRNLGNQKQVEDAQKLVNLHNEAYGHQLGFEGGSQQELANNDWYSQNQDTPPGILASRYGNFITDPTQPTGDTLKSIQQSFETLQSMSAIKDDRVMKHVKKGYSINSYNDIRSFSMSVGITTQDVHGIMATQGDWNVVAKQWNVSPIIVKATKVTFGGV